MINIEAQLKWQVALSEVSFVCGAIEGVAAKVSDSRTEEYLKSLSARLVKAEQLLRQGTYFPAN